MREKPFSKFQILANVVMIIWTLLIILPFILLFMSSITDENILVANGYSFFPQKFSGAAYGYLMQSGQKILTAYGISILVTLVGTAINVSLSALMAYPLSIRNLPGRKFMNFFVFFTMLFNGGIVPSYLLWTSLGVKDTFFAQLLPNFLVSAWNVMMIRTFFTTSIPDSLYEAAEIDGCTQGRFFFQIALPLSGAITAIMVLYYGVGHWNSYFSALIYMSDQNKFPLQLVLRSILITNEAALQQAATTPEAREALNAKKELVELMKYSLIIISSIPVLVLYPFIQRHFVKGVMIGSVKG